MTREEDLVVFWKKEDSVRVTVGDSKAPKRNEEKVEFFIWLHVSYASNGVSYMTVIRHTNNNVA